MPWCNACCNGCRCPEAAWIGGELRYRRCAQRVITMSTDTVQLRNRSDGITDVAVADLVALRARAGKPRQDATRLRATLAGGHASTLRGRGMDYAESRVYQAGDDVRHIDWRRTARSGVFHTKVFQVERERSAWLLLDTHPTMRFGTRTRYKSVAAARAAAWLAWTAVRAGDRVAALAFGSVRAAIDPRSGVRGALAVAGALAHWDAQAGAAVADAEPLSTALQRAARLVSRGSRVWLLTDGWCVDAAALSPLTQLARRVDLHVVAVADALERELVPAGAYVFDAGARARRVDLAAAAARARFRDRLGRGQQQLAEACAHAGVAMVTLTTLDEPDVALAPGLRRRARRP